MEQRLRIVPCLMRPELLAASYCPRRSLSLPSANFAGFLDTDSLFSALNTYTSPSVQLALMYVAAYAASLLSDTAR